MNNLIITFTFISVFLVGSVFCDEEIRSIEKNLEMCLDQDYSNVGMRSCSNIAHKEWDALMNKYYQLSMKHFDQSSKTALKKAQRAWIKFRDAEFSLISDVIAGTQGTMWQLTATGKGTDFVKKRALELKEYFCHYNDHIKNFEIDNFDCQ